MHIDHQQLRFFKEIAETGSINRAAARLHITQPALSRRMKSLERHIGADLFVRTSAGVDLTETGRRLLERSRVLGDAFLSMGESVNALGEETRSQFSVGTSPGAGMLVIDGLVAAFRSQAPDAVLRWLEGTSRELCDKVVDGELEVALLSGRITSTHLQTEVLWKEPLFLVRPREQTGDIPFALPTRDPYVRALIEQQLEGFGQPVNVGFEVHSAHGVKRLIERGHAYSILPYSAIHDELNGQLFDCARIAGSCLVRTIVWRRAPKLRPTTIMMLDVIRTLSRALAAKESTHSAYFV